MTKLRPLPTTDQRLYLTDGGLETTMIFQKGIELPCFASIELMRTFAGRAELRDYYDPFVAIARATGHGLILDTPTWRASPDWQLKIGFPDLVTMAEANAASVRFLDDLRNRNETPDCPMLISGVIGPRGDGYQPNNAMTAHQAEAYHTWQIRVLAKAGIDLLSAFTLSTVNEATGIARAAAEIDCPTVLSFTIETDGRLPSGVPLSDAIRAVDHATARSPLYYMINCAHPDHIAKAINGDPAWQDRIGGLRTNASRCSHAELDECLELDDGNPVELGTQMADLCSAFPNIGVMGGCCGTDHRHIAEIARAQGRIGQRDNASSRTEAA